MMSLGGLMFFTISIFCVLLTRTLSQRSRHFPDNHEDDFENDIPSRSCSVCGDSHPDGRVINGAVVNPKNKYPWMVALKNRRNQLFCGGAILNEWYILTAGHCFNFINPEEIRIVFTTSEGLTEGTPIGKVISHPNYTHGVAHDIGLIKMRDPITCDEYTSPICLPPFGMTLHPGWRTAYRIAGWGQMANKRQPQELLEGRIQIVPMEECFAFNPNDPFRSTSYCCKAFENTGPCFGDSGGSMFARFGSRFFSLGITSTHSSLSCDLSAPFVYVSVSMHMDWIKRETGIMPERIHRIHLPNSGHIVEKREAGGV